MQYIGLVTYGVLSVIESLINLILYLTFLYKFVPVSDFSLPFYFWFSNKYLKKSYIKSIQNGQDI